MSKSLSLFLAAAAISLALTACSTAPRSAEGKADIRKDSDIALVQAKASDPSMAKFFRDAYGSAVFPEVGKAGVGVGGAYGRGVLYQDGRVVGYCDLSQASIGFQLGAQTYTEILCFEDKRSFDRFKTGELTFNAQATAVALKSGAGENAKYSDGVSVFTMGESGLMYEAAIGGQKFSYQAL
ncbi:MAG: hypothetical protein HQ519_05550 [Planctomycetes bacterium]|nr:hypothetical protein [Planctomycetota bacterium]